MIFALDTNSVSYALRGEGRVADRLLSVSRNQVALPSVVLYELEAGLAKAGVGARRRKQFDEFMGSLRVLPFAEAEARVAAEIRVELERQGQPIGPHDTMIAATAVRHGAVLVTRNVREFGRVTGLRVEDWF